MAQQRLLLASVSLQPEQRPASSLQPLSTLFANMKQLCVVFIGVLLMARHLSSQVTTTEPATRSLNATVTTTLNNSSISTIGCELYIGLTLLLALAASVLPGWSL